MLDCIFCKIIKGEIPSAKVYEDEKCFAFLDINPVNYGHLLLIPKTHHQMMYDVPDELVAHMFIRVKELMVKVKEALQADYVTVSVVGLDVPHFHIHLIPRYHDDGLAGFWPTKKYGENEMLAIAEKIKSKI